MSTKILDLHDDLLSKILLFALGSSRRFLDTKDLHSRDIRDFLNYRRISKQFYNATDPNKPSINRIWEFITRRSFPHIPTKLKCKRWDKFCRYRIKVLNKWIDEWNECQQGGIDHIPSDEDDFEPI